MKIRLHFRRAVTLHRLRPLIADTSHLRSDVLMIRVLALGYSSGPTSSIRTVPTSTSSGCLGPDMLSFPAPAISGSVPCVMTSSCGVSCALFWCRRIVVNLVTPKAITHCSRRSKNTCQKLSLKSRDETKNAYLGFLVHFPVIPCQTHKDSDNDKADFYGHACVHGKKRLRFRDDDVEYDVGDGLSGRHLTS